MSSHNSAKHVAAGPRAQADLAALDAGFVAEFPKQVKKRARKRTEMPSRSPEKRQDEYARAKTSGNFKEKRANATLSAPNVKPASDLPPAPKSASALPPAPPPPAQPDATEIPEPVARLLELTNDLDAAFPTAIRPAHESPHIREYTAYTLDQSTEGTCCVCSEMVQASAMTTVPELPHAQLLSASAYGEPLPGVDPVNGLLLERAGLVLDDAGAVTGYTACSSCLSDLHRNLLPACALANGNALGAIPPELQDLTITERGVIAAYRVKGNIFILSQVGGSGTGQRAMRGNVAVFPQDAGKVAKLVLPLPVESLADTIAIVFIKDKRPTPAQLKKLFMVRASKVKAALRKLAEIHTTHGSAYAAFQIDEAALAALPEGEVPQVLLDGILEVDEASDLAAHAGYANGIQELVPDADPANPNEVSDPVVLSFSAYVDSSGSQHWTSAKQSAGFKQMLGDLRSKGVSAAAGSSAERSGQPPLLALPHASEYARDYDNATYWTDSYVDLFPYGRGGPEEPRRRAISIERWVRHHMRTHDPRFRKDPSFLFVASNHILRKQALLGVHLKMKHSDLAAIEAKFGKLSAAMLERVVAALDDPKAPVDDATRELAGFLRRTVESIQGGVPFSDAAKKRWRQEIFSLMVWYGFPLLWVTVNPADLHHPMVVRLARQDENLGDALINSLEQGRIVAGNPMRAAQFFSIVMDGVFKHLVKCFGDIKALYGVVEAQGRGTLHCHFLLWVNGYHTPTQLADRLNADPTLRERMIHYADAISTAVLPAEPPADADAPGTPPVVAIRPVRVEAVDPKTVTRAQFDGVLRELAISNQTHRHSPSCYIYGKLKCRHNFPFELQAETTMDDNGKITVKRHDPWVAKYNETLLWAVRCNCNIELVTGSKDARAIAMYLTEYMVKNNVTAREIYVASGHALRRIEADEASGKAVQSRTRALITKCCVAMVGLTQVSAPEAILLLLGYKDHYASETFVYLPVQLFVRWAHRAGEGPSGDDEVDLNGLGEGNIVTTASIVEHYLLRPPALAALCLYDFVATISIGPYDAANPSRTTMPFLPGHPQQRTVACRIRQVPVVPTLSYLPPSATADAARHASWHALLFVPFRKLTDLKAQPERTWEAVWLDALPGLCPRLVQIVTNMAEINMGMTAKQLLDNERRLAQDDPSIAQQGKGGWLADLGLFDEEDEDGLDPDGLGDVATGNRIVHTLVAMLGAGIIPADSFVTEAVASAELGGRFAVVPPPAHSAAAGNDQLDDGDAVRALANSALHVHGRVSPAVVASWQAQMKILDASRKRNRANGRPADDGAGGRPPASKVPGRAGPSTTAFDLHEQPALVSQAAAGAGSNGDAMRVDRDPAPGTPPAESESAGAEPELMDPNAAAAGSTELTLRSLLEGMTPPLNVEQRKAFLIIGRHVVQTFSAVVAAAGNSDHEQQRLPEQLLFYLGGPGGTGKSQVLKALRSLFETLGREAAFRVIAYTGAAAVLVEGETAHSISGMSRKSGTDSKDNDVLEARLAQVRYLFVDEVSMLGSAMLARLHNQFCAAKHAGHDVPFGGLNVIFAGDFYQLKPIEDRSLFSHPEIGDSQWRAAIRALQKVGKSLWMGLTNVVFLTEQMRQSDPVLRELLMAVRVGQGTEAHRQRLLTHSPSGVLQQEQFLMENGAPPDDPAVVALRRVSDTLKHGAVVVSRNAVRFEFILRTAQRVAAEKGTRLLFVLPKDVMPKTTIDFTEQMRARLLRLSESDAEGLPGILPLIAGETYYFTSKIAAELSAVNGMPCRLVSVILNQNEPDVNVEDLSEPYAFAHMPQALIVEVLNPAVPFQLDSFERNCLALTPARTSFAVQLRKLVPGFPDGKRTVVIRRVQFQLTPSWSVTTYKVQGKTMQQLVGDLRVPKKNGKAGKYGLDFGYSYTTLSRVTDWDGLAILSDFELASIQQKPPADLVEHTAWLEQRARATDDRLLQTAAADAEIDATALLPLRPAGYTGDTDLLKPQTDLHEQHLASMRAELAARAAAASPQRKRTQPSGAPPAAKHARMEPKSPNDAGVAPQLAAILKGVILRLTQEIPLQTGERLLLNGPEVARRLRQFANDVDHRWNVATYDGNARTFGWLEVAQILNSQSYVNDEIIDAVVAIATRIIAAAEGDNRTTATFRPVEFTSWEHAPSAAQIRQRALRVARSAGCNIAALARFVGICNLHANHWVAAVLDIPGRRLAIWDSLPPATGSREDHYRSVVRVAAATVGGPVELAPLDAHQPTQADGTSCSAYAALTFLHALQPDHGPAMEAFSRNSDLARLWLLQTLLDAAG